MKLTDKLKKIRDLMVSCCSETYHFTRPTQEVTQFIVWQEDSQSESLYTNNRLSEQVIHGTIDLFTKIEYDDLIDDIQSVLALNQISFTLLSVTYEEDTTFIHYEWEFYI